MEEIDVLKINNDDDDDDGDDDSIIALKILTNPGDLERLEFSKFQCYW